MLNGKLKLPTPPAAPHPVHQQQQQQQDDSSASTTTGGGGGHQKGKGNRLSLIFQKKKPEEEFIITSPTLISTTSSNSIGNSNSSSFTSSVGSSSEYNTPSTSPPPIPSSSPPSFKDLTQFQTRVNPHQSLPLPTPPSNKVSPREHPPLTHPVPANIDKPPIGILKRPPTNGGGHQNLSGKTSPNLHTATATKPPIIPPRNVSPNSVSPNLGSSSSSSTSPSPSPPSPTSSLTKPRSLSLKQPPTYSLNHPSNPNPNPNPNPHPPINRPQPPLPSTITSTSHINKSNTPPPPPSILNRPQPPLPTPSNTNNNHNNTNTTTNKPNQPALPPRRYTVHTTHPNNVSPSSSSPSNTSPPFTPQNVSPDIQSPQPEQLTRRRTMRHNLLTRKSASMNLSGDNYNSGGSDNGDDQDDEDNEMSSDSASSYSLNNNNEASNFSLITSQSLNNLGADGEYSEQADYEEVEDVQQEANIFTVPEKAVKKKKFFGTSKKLASAVDQIDPKDIIIEKLIAVNDSNEELTSRRLKVPAIDSSNPTKMVIKEIIETEADYLDDLAIMINYYMQVMKEVDETSSLNLVTLQEILVVFSNVEELFVINSKMLDMFIELVQTVEFKDEQYPSIEEVFFRHANSLKRYITYLSNQENCNKQLSAWENNTQISYLLNQVKSTIPIVKNLNLASYVIKPVQRLCKYPLLLRGLKKTIPEENEHYRNYERAAKLMEKIVSEINGKIKNECVMADLRTLFGKEGEAHLVKKTYIKDSKFKLMKKENGALKDCHVYLFDDSVILFKKKSFKKNSIKTIPFHCILNVQNIENRVKNGIDVIFIEKDNEHQQVYKYALSADNYMDKLLWLDELEDAIHAAKVFASDYESKSIHLQNSDHISKQSNHHY